MGSAKPSRFTLATNSFHLSRLTVMSVPPGSVDLRTSTCSSRVAISTHWPPSHCLALRHVGSSVDPQPTTSPQQRSGHRYIFRHNTDFSVMSICWSKICYY